jgi:acyl carrier protein
MSLTDTIIAFVAERTPEDVGPQTRFTDLDIDSLVLLELAAALKRDYGVLLTDDDLYAADTIEGAAALVSRRAPV